MLNAIIAGIISGIVSPIILQWLQHKYLWQRQKKLETKYAIFSDAVRALSLAAVDAGNPELQSSPKEHLGSRRKVQFRPETDELLQKAVVMVEAFFSERATAAFKNALRCDLSWQTLPHFEFQEKSVEAIIELSKDLGILSEPDSPQGFFWMSKVRTILRIK